MGCTEGHHTPTTSPRVQANDINTPTHLHWVNTNLALTTVLRRLMVKDWGRNLTRGTRPQGVLWPANFSEGTPLSVQISFEKNSRLRGYWQCAEITARPSSIVSRRTQVRGVGVPQWKTECHYPWSKGIFVLWGIFRTVKYRRTITGHKPGSICYFLIDNTDHRQSEDRLLTRPCC